MMPERLESTLPRDACRWYKPLLFALLVLASGSALAQWAQWFVVDSTDNFVIYADGATIRKQGDMARLWDMADAKGSKSPGLINQSLSYKIERAYDCNGQQMQTLYVSWHSGHMGEGEIVGSTSVPGMWQPVMMGTIGEKLWQVACGAYRRRL